MAETISPFEELVGNVEQCMKNRMELTVMYFQSKICKDLETLDECKTFTVDKWSRKEGGGGITCILQDGEKESFFIYIKFSLCFMTSLKWDYMRRDAGQGG